ncbi:MAG: hypothetical protein HYV93_23715 [Candidatus Rokubacteria bacterium]|nr:hypothetical protein [Candidatus Rokubacteria bacterium]
MAELTRRYIVMPMATEAPFDPLDPEAVFVLKPRKDPAALRALQAYRDHCYPELRRDLDAWIETIKASPVVRGGVGERNARYLASRPQPASAPAQGSAVPAARPTRAGVKPKPRPRAKHQGRKAKPPSRKRKQH